MVIRGVEKKSGAPRVVKKDDKTVVSDKTLSDRFDRVNELSKGEKSKSKETKKEKKQVKKVEKIEKKKPMKEKKDKNQFQRKTDRNNWTPNLQMNYHRISKKKRNPKQYKYIKQLFSSVPCH
jgi:hypothetical protein